MQALIADAVVNFFQDVLNFDVNNRRERLFAQDSSAVIAVARRRRQTNKAVFIFSGVVAHLSHLQLEFFSGILRQVGLDRDFVSDLLAAHRMNGGILHGLIEEHNHVA